MSTSTDPIEARVVARLDQEKAELDARVEASAATRANALVAVVTAREGSQTKLDRLYDLIDADKSLAGDVEAKALGSMAEWRKAVHAYAAAHEAVLAGRAARKKLNTKAEVERRIKQAKEYDPESDEPLTQRAAVELVLMRAGRPMHYREITRIGLQTGLIRTEGETPEATVSAMLATRAKAGDTFVKVEPGIFALLAVETPEVAA